MTRTVLLALCAVLVGCSSTVASKPDRRYAALADCDMPEITGKVLCGQVMVAENRAKPGRQIPIYTVVLLATGPTVKADPLVPVQGGPGQSATGMRRLFQNLLADLRRDRDIVLIDVRGTGGSNPLPCSATSPAWLKSGELMPAALIRECRTALESRADLTQYTTPELARDLEDVRKALGIERWNLFGTSYGTRLSQEYARMFPAQVRTMTLHGVVGPSLAMPLSYARDAQDALDRILAPATRALLPKVLAQLAAEPAVVPTANGDLTITPGVFAEALRNLIYDANAADRADAMIRHAANGDFSDAVQAAMRQRNGFANGISMGMFLSVTCTEDIPRIDQRTIAESSRDTFLGDYRVRQQMGACREWPRGAPNDVGKLLVSDVPTLLVSGENDPVTPPRFGEEVLAGLPNGVHLTLPAEAHGFGPNTRCVVGVMKDLIDAGDTSRLSAQCGGRVSRK